MKNLIILTALLGLLAGCADKVNETTTGAEPAPPPAEAEAEAEVEPLDLPQPGAEPSAGSTIMDADPTNLLVSVDDHGLTLGEARKQADMRLSSVRARVQPEQYQRLQAQTMGRIVNDFILRSLLLDEAKKRTVTLTEEEKNQAFDDLREKLPPGKTLEQAMADSPMSAEDIRKDVLEQARIRKMVDTVVPQDPEITDAEVQAFAQTNQQAETPASVTASHILVKTTEEDSAEAKEAKKEKLAGIRKQIVEGADFAEMATEHSECPSAQRGGDLGTFKKGQMVKPFEEAAFAQELNEVGDIVETDFGYHIIKVTERTEAGTMPEDKIRDLIKRKEQQQAFETFVDDLREKADIEFGDLLQQNS